MMALIETGLAVMLIIGIIWLIVTLIGVVVILYDVWKNRRM